MHVEFRSSRGASLGVEWELALVDARTGELVPVADQVLAAVSPPGTGDQSRVHRELLLNTVELVTGVCTGVPEVVADLAESLAQVRAVTDPIGVELFSAGTHPFAQPETQPITAGRRYATLIDRTQWWGRQMLIYGVHIHVGITSAAKVLPLLNGLLPYAPHLQALSAASPFWAGTDTGYVSNRALMFQQLPTAGLPFQFQQWADYEAYVEDLYATGVIEELAEIRWDIRPSPDLGTLEVRVCDGVPTLHEVGALAALVHCLVVDLDRRLVGGERLPTLPPWHVQENKWRAARYGLQAEVVLDAANRERLVTDDLADLLDRLAPVARQLGCTAQLAAVEDIVRVGCSADRQRSVAAAAGGDLRAVVAALVSETRRGRP